MCCPAPDRSYIDHIRHHQWLNVHFGCHHRYRKTDHSLRVYFHESCSFRRCLVVVYYCWCRWVCKHYQVPTITNNRMIVWNLGNYRVQYSIFTLGFLRTRSGLPGSRFIFPDDDGVGSIMGFGKDAGALTRLKSLDILKKSSISSMFLRPNVI